MESAYLTLLSSVVYENTIVGVWVQQVAVQRDHSERVGVLTVFLLCAVNTHGFGIMFVPYMPGQGTTHSLNQMENTSV